MTKENELDTTIDEWRAEMEGLHENDPGNTARELAGEFGISTRTMQEHLRNLIEAGKCKAGMAVRPSRRGFRRVPVYQLTQKKKAGK